MATRSAGTVTQWPECSTQILTGLAAAAPSNATAWAAYRALVGEYLFRTFDPASQISAIAEFEAALTLDPSNSDAKTMLARIIQQATPSGLPRDIDVVLDYPALADHANQEADILLGMYGAFQTQGGTEAVLNALYQQ